MPHLSLRADTRRSRARRDRLIGAAGREYGRRNLPSPDGDHAWFEDALVAGALSDIASLDGAFHQRAARLDWQIDRTAADLEAARAKEERARQRRDRCKERLDALDGGMAAPHSLDTQRRLSSAARVGALVVIAGGDALLTVLAFQLFGGSMVEAVGAAAAVMVALLALARVLGMKLREGGRADAPVRLTMVFAACGIAGIAGLRSVLLALDGDKPLELLPWFLGIQIVLFGGAVFVEYLHHNDLADRYEHTSHEGARAERRWRARAASVATLQGRLEGLADALLRLEWEIGAHKSSHLHRSTLLRAQFRSAAVLGDEHSGRAFTDPIEQAAEPSPARAEPARTEAVHARLFSARHCAMVPDRTAGPGRAHTDNGSAPAGEVVR